MSRRDLALMRSRVVDFSRFVLTNLRAVIVDVSGFTGNRVAYKSIPYGSIRGFSVESAGTFDRDSELSIYTRNQWSMKEVGFDFRKHGADIMAIKKFLCA